MIQYTPRTFTVAGILFKVIEKNFQEQSIYLYVLHNLYTQQPPFPGIRL